MKLTTSRNPHSAFTLVELLVVIGIIAALASLILVAGSAAIRAAREAAIQTECVQLADGFQAYTNDVSGGSFPPNVAGHPQADALNAFNRHFNKAFGSHRESPELIRLLATGVSSNSDYSLTGTAGALTPYESVVFWLGGFSDDPKYPISGPGGPSYRITDGEDFAARGKIFDFEQTRLGPTTNGQFSGRYIEYPDPRDNTITRRINLWYYVPKNLTVPYAYFDSSGKPKFETAWNNVVPIKALKVNASAQTVGNLRLANDGKCQILAAGLDDTWGNLAENNAVDWSMPATQYNGLLYPEGPWTGELADTITNFGTGRTLEDSQP